MYYFIICLRFSLEKHFERQSAAFNSGPIVCVFHGSDIFPVDTLC